MTNNVEWWTTKNMGQFWGFVQMLLKAAMPWIMIAVAVICVGLLLGIVVKAWNQSAKELEESDDDYEIKHY